MLHVYIVGLIPVFFMSLAYNYWVLKTVYTQLTRTLLVPAPTLWLLVPTSVVTTVIWPIAAVSLATYGVALLCSPKLRQLRSERQRVLTSLAKALES